MTQSHQTKYLSFFRRRQPLLVLCLGFVLMVNTLAPLAAQASSDGQPQQFLLCTSTGFQWVDADQEQAPTAGKSISCVFCFNLDDDHALLSKSVESSWYVSSTQTLQSDVYNSPYSYTAYLFKTPRAPPALNES